MDEDRSAFEQVRDRIEGASGVHLSQGVVGKSTYAAVAFFGMMGIAAYAAKGSTGVVAIAALATFVFLIYFLGNIWFAVKNPGLALLEGAHLIMWRQLDVGAKNMPDIDAVAEPVTNPALKDMGSSEHE